MPTGIHTVELNVPINDVWMFVSNINEWAPLVPGYAVHEMIDDREYTWTFAVESRVIQRNIKLRIKINQWEEPSLITFHLLGIGENITGHGYFKATTLANTKTMMTGKLCISAKGIMSPMINTFLYSILPKMTRRFTEKVASEIQLSTRVQTI